MPLMIVLGFFILEVVSVSRFSGAYGIANTLFALVAMAVLGVGILRNQGRFMLTRLQRVQQSLVRGQAPSDDVLHGVLVLLAGLLFLLPGFFSDLIALLLLLPGSRHLLLWFLKRRLKKQGVNSRFKVYTFGMGSPWPPRDVSPFEPHSLERDVSEYKSEDVSRRVIDVTPIAVEASPEAPSAGPSPSSSKPKPE